MFWFLLVVAVNSRPIDDDIGQLTMVNINALVIPGTVQLNATKWAEVVRKTRAGSVFNSPTADDPTLQPLGLMEWRDLITQMSGIAVKEGIETPIIYGIDSVHGAGYVRNATLFPHQINVAATFDTNLAMLQGHITAMETRAAGLAWNFSPVLDVTTNHAWPRVYETFGEDPTLVAAMGVATIVGLQDTTFAELPTVATTKHFVGYSASRTGQDRTPVWLPDNYVHMYYLPPFAAGVDAHVGSVMEAYTDIAGRPVVASKRYLQTVLRDELHFSGVLVTDYNEIQNLVTWHRVASDYKDAVRMVYTETSLDVSMCGTGLETAFTDNLKQAVMDGQVPVERISQSVDRVLKMKADLGLWEAVVPPLPTSRCVFACPESRQAALEVAQRSLTLLKNNQVLPLNKGTLSRVLVVGPAGNSLTVQSGGWTMHWQGATGDHEFTYGTTVYTALRDAFPVTTVVYEEGCPMDEPCDTATLQKAVEEAKIADVVIIALGESPYTELPGDTNDLTLPSSQLELVSALKTSGTTLITVLIQGRPRLLRNVVDDTDAILLAYLPGPDGGAAVASVLLGEFNPAGRLPYSYPMTPSNAPLLYWGRCNERYEVQWGFGYGLSYTEYHYQHLQVHVVGGITGDVHVDVTITNAGHMAGNTSILVYCRQHVRTITPERHMLRAFTSLSLGVGETRQVSLTFPVASLSYVTPEGCRALDPGTFTVEVDELKATFELTQGMPCRPADPFPTKYV